MFGAGHKFGNSTLQDIISATERVYRHNLLCAPYRRYLYGQAPSDPPAEGHDVKLGLVISSALSDSIGSNTLSSAISCRVAARSASSDLRLTSLVARSMLSGVERAAREIGNQNASLALTNQ